MGSIGRASLTLAVLPCCVRRAPSRGLVCQSLPTGGFYASPTSLPNSPLGIFGTRRTSAPVFGTPSLSAVPTFGLGFLAPADNRFDLIRSSGAGVAHCRWYLLLRGSLIVDWLCLDDLLWYSSLALHFSWFTLLGYSGRISTGGGERRRLRVHF